MDESAQGELRRFYAAADGWAPFQNHAAKSGFRQVRRGDQAVVSGARNDDVETVRGGRTVAPRHSANVSAKRSKRRAFHESTPGDSAHTFPNYGPPTTNLFQVGQAFQVLSLFQFKSFVNHISPAPRTFAPMLGDKNISAQDRLAYDCAANSSTALKIIPVAEARCAFQRCSRLHLFP